MRRNPLLVIATMLAVLVSSFLVFTTLSAKEKYKSTVFIDTFTNRFGDATGGLLFNSLLSMGLVIYTAPLAIIPLAIFLISLGWNISKNVDTKKSA